MRVWRTWATLLFSPLDVKCVIPQKGKHSYPLSQHLQPWVCTQEDGDVCLHRVAPKY